jgi:vacuolar-type H+-ATPase subunit I/STV1
MHHTFNLGDLAKPWCWIPTGVYFILTGIFSNHYRWRTGVYAKWHPMTPGMRPVSFTLGVFSLALGIFFRVVETSYPVHATYAKAIVGAGLVAFVPG